MVGFIFVSWYLIVYWIINVVVVFVVFLKVLKCKKGGYVIWLSLDRGNI